MEWSKRLIRATAGCLGKAITFIFALFCVISGLVGTGSAQSTDTISGTVRNRVNFSPIDSIQIILADVMCPVYGINLPCSFGRALDTASSDRKGAFTVSGTGYGLGLQVTDIDGRQNGSFQSRKILNSKTVLQKTGGVVYMLPTNATYQVKAKVLTMDNGTPIKGIKATLLQHSLSCLPSYICQSVYSQIDTAYSNLDGSIVFNLKTELSNTKISVSDIDGKINGGSFLTKNSEAFSPIDDTATTIVRMEKEVSVVSHPGNRPGSSIPFSIRKDGGVVSVTVNNWQPGLQPRLHILDARGVTIARLQPTTDGIAQWNTGGLPCGIYFLCLENSKKMLATGRIVLP